LLLHKIDQTVVRDHLNRVVGMDREEPRANPSHRRLRKGHPHPTGACGDGLVLGLMVRAAVLAPSDGLAKTLDRISDK
jgi:hypothetical protein